MKKLLLLVLAFPLSASGQLSRTAVSVSGLDTNACSVAAPCRSFTAALAQTNPGGEVIAIDSGGYGPFTVTQSVSVIGAAGIYAGITALAGNGVTVTPSNNATVVLRNLYLNGGGTGSAGVAFSTGTGAKLHIENLFVQGFNYGLYSYLPMRIVDTKIFNCFVGVYLDNAGAPLIASADRVTIRGASGGTGFYVWRNTRLTLRDSLIVQTGTGVFLEQGATSAFVENTMSVQNQIGIQVSAGVARLSNCMLADNAQYGLVVDNASVQSFLNNRIRGNQTGDMEMLNGGTVVPVLMN